MRIIRPGIAAMRYVPERRPTKLGYECDKCSCIFEADYEEATPVTLYGNYGRIVEIAYTCPCPNCKERLTAESFLYDEEKKE